MFDNVGNFIKRFAVIIMWVKIIGSIIGGIVCMSAGNGGENFLIGLAIMVGGGCVAIVSAALLYGYGELIEKTTDISNTIKKQEINKHPEEKQEHINEELPKI